MKVIDRIKQMAGFIDRFVEVEWQKAQPWLKAFMTEVEHDVVTQIMPIIETAGAQVAVSIASGNPVAAIGETVAAIALQAGKDIEKAGISATAHDLSAGITGYMANLHKTGVAATAMQTATTAQAQAAATP